MKELVHDTLGFHPERIEKMPSGAVRVQISHDRFPQVVVHWVGTAIPERPRLRALMPAAADATRLLLDYVLEIPGSATLLCLEVDVPRDRTLPSVTAVWPFAEWWQEELTVFNGARFEGAPAREESPWQQA